MPPTPVELAALSIGDPPAVWRELGFVVDRDAAYVSGVRHQLGGTEPGIAGWSVRGLDGAASIDGLPLDSPAPAAVEPTPAHPNGVVAIDHVVLFTPDLGRTIDAFETVGVELRRIRDAGGGRQQAFFKLRDVIIEVVGPVGDHTRFWGITWTVRDLDATKACLGDRLRPPKDAVQRGRRIATLDRSAGSTVPMAFMSAPGPRP